MIWQSSRRTAELPQLFREAGGVAARSLHRCVQQHDDALAATDLRLEEQNFVLQPGAICRLSRAYILAYAHVLRTANQAALIYFRQIAAREGGQQRGRRQGGDGPPRTGRV